MLIPCAKVSFTAKELREMMHLPDTLFFMDKEILNRELSLNADLVSANRPLKRLMQILEKGSSNVGGTRSWTLKFLRTPTALLGDTSTPIPYVNRVQLAVNRLEGPPDKCVAIGTGEVDELQTGLVLKSLGYRSVAVEGVPFNERSGIVPNNKGKVLDEQGNEVCCQLRSYSTLYICTRTHNLT
jgi:adrenodoxin-NADP+ reductase